MNDLRTAAQQALEALELGHAAAHAEAQQYRVAMKGYRPERHAQMDAEVQQIADAAAALRAALAQPEGGGNLPPPLQPEPGAVVGTQFNVWRFYNGQWAPPGEPIKMAHMLKDLPLGTLLYTTPHKRKPLTEEQLEKVFPAIASYAEANKTLYRSIARAVERAHGIIESAIKEDKA